ncbi:hypothetical protein ACF0H5_004274 [Mactra antiquata]
MPGNLYQKPVSKGPVLIVLHKNINSAQKMCPNKFEYNFHNARSDKKDVKQSQQAVQPSPDITGKSQQPKLFATPIPVYTKLLIN